MAGSKRHKYPWQYVLLGLAVLMIAYSFVLKNHIINRGSLSNYAAQFEQQINTRINDFKSVLKDTTLVNRLLNATESEADVLYLWNKPYYFYLYKDGARSDYIRFWNSNQILPPDSILADDVKDELFAKLSNGYYYIYQQRLAQQPDVTAYCMILIKSEYYIPTEYLKQTYPFDNSLDKLAELSLEPTPYPVKSPQGLSLFYFESKPDAEFNKDSEFSIALRLGGLFLLFLAFYFILHKAYTSTDLIKDTYIFISCMLGFRLIIYFFYNALNLGAFELFDPEIYSSGIFLPNLGDLLINSILFCAITGFIWQRISNTGIKVSFFQSTKAKMAIGITGLAVLVFATFTIAGIIKSLIVDSNISFDVTNYFSLTIYTAVGFIILAALSLGYHYFSRILFQVSTVTFKNRLYLVYFIIAITGLLFCSFSAYRVPASINFYIPCLIWLMLYTAFFLNEARLKNFLSVNITGVIVWIFIFSISISILMLNEIRKNELIQRKIYVEKLATQTDVASQKIINLSHKYLDTNYFISNFSRLYDKEVNKLFRDSIYKHAYISYVKNYTTSIYLYDSLDRPMFNPSDISLESLNTVIKTQTTPTTFDDLYFYELGIDKFSYITYRPVFDTSGNKYGTVVIFSNPRKFANEEINAELFKQYGQWEISHPSVYYYAVYQNKLLISSTKQYPFTSTLTQSELPATRYEQRNDKEYNELWYRPNSTTVVVMARRSEPFLETITLFSYIFCAFLLLLAVTNLLLLSIDWLLNSKFFRQRNIFRASIRGQIHNTFIIITLLSFIVVGIATVSFFIDRFRVVNNERLSRTMNVMINEMQMRTDLASLVFEERAQMDSIDFSSELNSIIKNVSEIHGMDLNIYDISGRLLASSLPDLFQKGVISSRMGPRAYYHLLRLRSIEHIERESISDLSYTSIYSPLRDKEGALFAYISVPYFTSQHELNQEISNFLVTLINLNAFIFLITGLVALLITNRITRSFRLISEKMNAVSLSKNNELIQWQGDDEIGSLVKEYNKMVAKLQESANELATSERQSAWQEMARQVAHEIKNPLTPMKLSLQYLQRAINDDRGDITRLAANVSKTLVEQIDHLSKIATNFSQFANIGTANREIFDLHHSLSQLNSLHKNNHEIEYTWLPVKGEVYVNADKTQVNRLFTNLIANAIEATSGNTRRIVKVFETFERDTIIIGVEDNGAGISHEMLEKIFTPNFTTKTSGTGLGLAMSKAIVEQSGGAIWFETKIGVGTTFYIKLPVVPS